MVKKPVAIFILVAATCAAVVALGIYAVMIGPHSVPSALSPNVPVVFEWNDDGTVRCEVWYPPPSAYYFPCAKVGEQKTLQEFRRYAGRPPEKLGFPSPGTP